MSFDDVCLIRNLFVFVSFTSKEMHYVFRFVEKNLAISILISSWYIGTCPDCSQCYAALLPIFTPKRFSLLIFFQKTACLDLKFLNFETTGYFTMMSHHDQMKNFCQTFAKLN